MQQRSIMGLLRQRKRERQREQAARRQRSALLGTPWGRVPDGVSGEAVVVAATPVPFLKQYLREQGLTNPRMFSVEGVRKGWRTVDSVAALHRQLLKKGPYGLMMVETQLFGQPELLRELLYYLGDGGYFVLVGDLSQENDAGERPLDDLLSVRGKEKPGAFSEAISELAADGASLMIRKRGHHFVPMREDRFSGKFAHKMGWGWVEVRDVEYARPISYPPPASLNMPEYANRFRKDACLPVLRIRSYQNVIVAPRQVVAKNLLLLPETFRHYRRTKLKTRRSTLWINDRFMKLQDSPAGEAVELRGEYLHLDSEFVHVYGHLVTEVLSRVWAWAMLRAEYPNLKVLVGTYEGSETIPSWFVDTLVAAGIPAGEIVPFHGPTRVERLFGATPLFSTPYVAHPRVLETWATIRDGLVADLDEDVDTPERVFVARKAGATRSCHQEEELLDLFRSHGFEIFFPEDHSVNYQALVFKNASVVAGYGGSGMLNGIYGSPGQEWIVIAPDTYTATNEHLICALFGNPVHYFYGTADIRHPRGRWSVRAFKSDFSFDLDEHGRGLRELLVSLA